MSLNKKDFQNIAFTASYTMISQLPEPSTGNQEWAIAGRSNVGKSTVINALCGNKKMAKTSSTPGKTRELVFFSVAGKITFVDLPGYGYAKVSKKMQESWGRELTKYIIERKNLIGIMIIMDIRHPLTLLDRKMLDLAAEREELDIVIVLNKADKLSKTARIAAENSIMKDLKAKYGTRDISCVSVSGYKKQGLEELKEMLISEINQAAQEA